MGIFDFLKRKEPQNKNNQINTSKEVNINQDIKEEPEKIDVVSSEKIINNNEAIELIIPEGEELKKIIKEIAKSNIDETSLFSSENTDELFNDAARVIVTAQQGSTSLIQRKLSLGYNRAGRIMDQLEATGIVGPFEGSSARRVLITNLNSLEILLESLGNNVLSKENIYKRKLIDKVEKLYPEEIKFEELNIIDERRKEEIKNTLLAKEFEKQDKLRQKELEEEVKRELIEKGLITENINETQKRREKIPEDIKNAVWNRDNGKCVICGSNEKLEFDHIIPFSKGGANTYRNLQLLCEKCNRQKSNKIG